MIISGLVGNETAEKVLLYLENYESGYPRAIAQNFEISVSQVQKQLERLEREGVVVSKLYGKVRIYCLEYTLFLLERIALNFEKITSITAGINT